MKILFIGGTGFISTAVSKLALAQGHELYLLNRGQRQIEIAGSHHLVADFHQIEDARAVLRGMKFDVVVDWIAYHVNDIERDLELFRDKTKQFIFISSASAYQKPPSHYLITESTPLYNPYWDYSQNKIACEERLMRAYREENFPITIVRPSLTYDWNFPIAIGGWGGYTFADRLKKNKPIIVHGDGTSLWTVTHSEDVGRGMLGLFGNTQAIGHPFHITSDEVLTWDQIYTIIAEAVGVKPNIVHISSDFISKVMPHMRGSLLGDKSYSAVFDNSKIKTFVPNYQAIIPFYVGIRRTLAWFDADEKRRWIDDNVNIEMDQILQAYAAL